VRAARRAEERAAAPARALTPARAPPADPYPTPALPAATTLADPVLVSVAAAHGVTPAQAALGWLWALGVPSNPRTMNATHMRENLAAIGALAASPLTAAEMAALGARPLDSCDVDPDFYECVPAGGYDGRARTPFARAR